MRLSSVILLASVLLAGCATPEPGEGSLTAASVVPAADAGPETKFVNGTFSGIGLIALPGYDCTTSLILPEEVASSDNFADTFEPGTNATAILLELRWNDAAIDLDFALRAPDAFGYGVRNGAPQTSPSGHRYEACEAGGPEPFASILVDDPEALALEGEWSWNVAQKDRAIEAPFTLAITVFKGSAPPAGFTALPARP